MRCNSIKLHSEKNSVKTKFHVTSGQWIRHCFSRQYNFLWKTLNLPGSMPLLTAIFTKAWTISMQLGLPPPRWVVKNKKLDTSNDSLRKGRCRIATFLSRCQCKKVSKSQANIIKTYNLQRISCSQLRPFICTISYSHTFMWCLEMFHLMTSAASRKGGAAVVPRSGDCTGGPRCGHWTCYRRVGDIERHIYKYGGCFLNMMNLVISISSVQCADRFTVSSKSYNLVLAKIRQDRKTHQYVIAPGVDPGLVVCGTFAQLLALDELRL